MLKKICSNTCALRICLHMLVEMENEKKGGMKGQRGLNTTRLEDDSFI
jgi:hypothetical protein